MKEFIEFKHQDGRRFAVRTGYTTTVNENEGGNVTLGIDFANRGMESEVGEPYDQVIAKLEASENVDMSSTQPFTDEEYKYIEVCVLFAMEHTHKGSDKYNDLERIHEKISVMKGKNNG